VLSLRVSEIAIMKKHALVFIAPFVGCCILSPIQAQTDTLKAAQLQTVFISEKKPSFATTSRNITAITNTEMKEYGAQTLADALASLPGVSQITTGAISKPVIRGVSGNRIQVNVAGLRLEDQQWEDEHGLGLSDVGVERVELIKGPAALLFGSDAIGGVINIIEEDNQTGGVLRQNLNLKIFSNTLGAGVDYGIKKGDAHNAFSIRAGYDSHGDYLDGKGQQIPNTLFSLANLKVSYTHKKGNWTSENRALGSYNQFGFIADTSELKESDERSRWARSFSGANHSVLFGVLSSKNTLQLNEKTKLTATAGTQINHRQEIERSKRADLDLWLLTANLNVNLERQLPNRWSWTSGFASMLQFNNNVGSRIIVPDANQLEGGLYTYLKKQQLLGEAIGNFECGLRLNSRQVDTRLTKNFNPVGSTIPPFNKNFTSFNGAIGQSFLLKHFTLKANIETGFRGGNLAELSANGLHEGTPNWYLGNPNMKIEQALNSELTLGWQKGWFNLHAGVYYNKYFNYIYLSPTNENYFGFPIFRFLQTNATFYGYELDAVIAKTDVFSINIDYSWLHSKRDDGSALPYTPANRLLLSSRYYLPLKTDHWKTFVSAGAQIVYAQNRVSANEKTSPAYWLLQGGCGVQHGGMRILLSGRNLLNHAYNDHLSRFRQFGILDMGRNIVMNCSWQF
jgi:iron complex outermembrane receptor protein